ncbi:CoA-dependent acyltransferase [Backusella circina FSU 941]|nr:CoA-dependent acyltransferase [Backusella circina FSU 941]
MATFSLQNTLPRLPVPSLEETCKLYIKSIEPLLSPEDFAQSKKKVLNFLNGPVGPSLQQRLIDIDRTSPFNWLEDNFWLRKAYMEWREPLMINSDWYIMGQHDLHHPQSLLESKVSGKFSRFQVRRAAHMIFRGLVFKEKIDRQELPIERFKGGEPQCMWQYSRIFSVTRIPSYHCDTLLESTHQKHIIVLVRDQIYKVLVYKELKDDIWQLLTTDEIELELYKVIADVHHRRELSAPVGVLSSWHRDKWTTARNHLLTLDPTNRKTLNEIETSLFAVALDDHSIGVQENQLTRTMFCDSDLIKIKYLIYQTFYT